MAATISVYDKNGGVISSMRMADGALGPGMTVRVFASQRHNTISTTNYYEAARARYVYVQEQLALNAVRTGQTVVDAERTRHILEGSPTFRTVNTKTGANTRTATVQSWSGGHANPEAAAFGKTQIPKFWTGERFMYEVADILQDDGAKWYLQKNNAYMQARGDANERFVCVEERYGVPIRVVAERDNESDMLKCITAFPDYSRMKFDENLRVN